MKLFFFVLLADVNLQAHPSMDLIINHITKYIITKSHARLVHMFAYVCMCSDRTVYMGGGGLIIEH